MRAHQNESRVLRRIIKWQAPINVPRTEIENHVAYCGDNMVCPMVYVSTLVGTFYFMVHGHVWIFGITFFTPLCHAQVMSAT